MEIAAKTNISANFSQGNNSLSNRPLLGKPQPQSEKKFSAYLKRPLPENCAVIEILHKIPLKAKCCTFDQKEPDSIQLYSMPKNIEDNEERLSMGIQGSDNKQQGQILNNENVISRGFDMHKSQRISQHEPEIFSRSDEKSNLNNLFVNSPEYDILPGIGENKYSTPIADTFLKNAINDNLILDVSTIDYVPKLYQQKQVPLTRIGPIFSDTLILFTLVHEKFITSSNGHAYIMQEPMRRFFGSVRDAFKGQITFSGQQPCTPILLSSKTSHHAKRMREFLAKSPELWLSYQRFLLNLTNHSNCAFNNVYLFRAKFGVYTMELSKLVDGLRLALKQLENDFIFLHDIDITVDCSGTMKKEQIIQHLLKQKIVSKALWKKLQFENGENDQNEIQKSENLLGYYEDNDNAQVGKDCVQYKIFKGDSYFRCKLYNKFIENFTVGGSLKEKFGNLIHCYLETPENDLLSEKFSHIEICNKGITRIEMTVYNFCLSDSDKYKQLLVENMDNLVARYPLFYEVPLSVQWEQISSKIKSSMMIFDYTSRIAYCGFWCNSLTKRITGVKYGTEACDRNDVWERVKEHCKVLFSFPDTPCYAIDALFIENSEEFRIKVKTSCFIKSSASNQPSLFSTGNINANSEFSQKETPVFTFCGSPKGIFKKGHKLLDYTKLCFRNTAIKFSTLTKSIVPNSAYLYKIEEAPSSIKDSRKLLGLTQERLSIFLKNSLIQKVLEPIREELKHSVHPNSSKGIQALENYRSIKSLERIKRDNLASAIELTKGKIRGLLSICVYEWSGPLWDHSRTPTKGKEVLLTVVLLKIINKNEVIFRTAETFEEKNVFYANVEIKDSLYNEGRNTNMHTSLHNIEAVVNDPEEHCQYYGIPPRFNVPLLKIKIDGFKYCYCGVQWKPNITDIQFLSGWELLNTLKKDDKGGDKENELIDAGIPSLALKQLVYDTTLNSTLPKYCKQTDNIPKDSTVIIRRIQQITYRGNSRYIFKAEISPVSELDDASLPFISSLGLNYQLLQLNEKTPFFSRFEAIVMKATGVFTDKISKRAEMHFEIAE